MRRFWAIAAMICLCASFLMGCGGSGAAVFNVDPGNYEAHFLKPPAGYQKNKETTIII